MRSYVFIKDEGYSSNLYNNSIEYLNKKELACSFGGSEVYKIKLMNSKEVKDLIGNHPMMINAKEIITENERGISLVSFGGIVFSVPIDLMISQSKVHGISTLVSFEETNYESEKLKKAEALDPEMIKEKNGLGFIYLVMLNLEGTDLFYLILNPTLVKPVGHIEIESDEVWIQQIKGIKDTVKDSVFGLDVVPKPISKNIFSGGLCYIDMMAESIIQPEDREEFFQQLKIQITHREKDCSTVTSFKEINGGHCISMAHGVTTPLVIEVKNKLLDNFINKNEELKWEFTVFKEE